jgi:hypothetical protein
MDDKKKKRVYRRSVKGASGKRVPSTQGRTGEKYEPRAQGTTAGRKGRYKKEKTVKVTPYAPSKFRTGKQRGPSKAQAELGAGTYTKKEARKAVGRKALKDPTVKVGTKTTFVPSGKPRVKRHKKQ